MLLWIYRYKTSHATLVMLHWRTQPSLLPLPLGEGWGEGPQRPQKKPLTLPLSRHKRQVKLEGLVVAGLGSIPSPSGRGVG